MLDEIMTGEPEVARRDSTRLGANAAAADSAFGAIDHQVRSSPRRPHGRLLRLVGLSQPLAFDRTELV